LFGSFSVLLYLFYRLGLLNIADQILVFSRQGVQTSLAPGGELVFERRDIKSVGLRNVLGVDCLRVELIPDPQVFDRYMHDKGLIAGLLGRVFGLDLLVPLAWMDHPRVEIASFVRGYQDFMRTRVEEKLQARTRFEQRTIPPPRAAKPPVVAPDATRPSDEASPPQQEPSSEATATRPLNLFESTHAADAEGGDSRSFVREKAVVLQRIKKIQKMVRESLLDRKTSEYFYEHFRHYPQWREANDPRVPPDLLSAQATHRGDAEVLLLDFRGHKFVFEYHPGAAGDDDRLSLNVDGENKLTLRVQLEINSLSPVEIEEFHRGDWLRLYAGLLAHVDALAAKSGGGIHRESQAVSQEATQTRGLAELRKRFQID
jgi:hypothetical protein